MNIGILPLISCAVSFIFALAVFDQFLTRKQPYQLIWAIGLLMYSVGTGAEFWVEAWGLNQVVYRLWYLSGAIYAASFLGMGTLYLLVRRRIAHVIMAFLMLASIYAAVRVFSAGVDISHLESLSGVAMPQTIRLLTPFFNTFGTVALVGGAIYSALVYWRRRVKPHRVLSNILIAFGAILPAFGGLHIRISGTINLFYVFELLGIIIIFIGFLRSNEVFSSYRFPFINRLRKMPAE
ncbi:MAG: hypothetical protein A2144_08770 [Chloroflexi bacterium RBG_16_50_9]|nr:MAG: hypothetical protein A2144_08770 [Chloroflexi bacterium RBG_16_50_9]